MSIKTYLYENKYTKTIYRKLRNDYIQKHYLTGEHKFINRTEGHEKLCLVLAGYKNYLIPAVMGRLKKFAPADMDICIITSGKWSEEINKLCEENNWSYLSTKRNNVALAQNMGIELHKKAKYIFKLDEDIFLTEKYFERMYDTYIECKKSSDYNIGVLAPLLPINGYGHFRLINKFGLTDMYKKKFGDLKIAAGIDRAIENSPELARFMWGETIQLDGKEYRLPTIDAMNKKLSEEPAEVEACPIRFSIGAILFERKLWKDMGYFKVDMGAGMGRDEAQLCSFCLLESRPIMVSSNILVGHLAFGSQNKSMQEYLEANTDLFLPPKHEEAIDGE
jgi:hypothetical protein